MIGIIGLGVILFASTNVDDIFVLLAFFADPKVPVRHVIFGQCLGIAALVLASLILSMIALVLTHEQIGLLGVLPVLIGCKRIYEMRRDVGEASNPGHGAIGATLSVAVVTIANGGDNIGIYTPVFAASSAWEIASLMTVFALMTAAWLALSFGLVNHPRLGAPIRRCGGKLVPFVLIGIGCMILYEGGSLRLLSNLV